MDIKEEIKSEELTIVKLGADWCGPCRLVAPILEKHSTNNRIFIKLEVFLHYCFSKMGN
jgi:thiol-disulfide isomerase/thioredoxin